MKCTAFKTVAFVISLCTISAADANDAALTDSSLARPGYTIISRDVVVQDGDTLISIARQQLGKSAFAPLLAGYNNLSVSATLQSGDIVRIPIQVPPRGEFAEVVFVKGTVIATRRLDTGTRGTATNTPMARTVVNVTQDNVETEEIILLRDAQVFPGDTITTSRNSYISIAFSSDSVINLQPETVATIERLVCLESDDSCIIEINTQRGSVTSDVEARDQQPVEFRINTPYASAAVRGTVFDMDAADQLLVGVTEGGVDVSAQGESVVLDTGFGLTVQEGEPPGDPIELIPAPVFKRVPARIAAGDTVEWWPFIDAANYQVQLSTDEAANETLSQFDVTGDDIVLDLRDTMTEPVNSGDYFLTVRAVDTNGLLGFTSNTRITLADIDPDIGTINTRVLREGSEFIITVDEDSRPAEAQGYEIQISSDETFADPLSLDVNEQGIAVFRVDADQVFTRARALIDPFTVSAFGEVSSN